MVEIIAIVIGLHGSLQPTRHLNGVTVDLQHLVHRHAVGDRIKIVSISQQKAQRVADAAIAFDHALENFVRDRQLARIIGIGYPKTQNLGAHLVGHFLRINDIADRLRHLTALAIHHEAMGQQSLVRCAAIERTTGQ